MSHTDEAAPDMQVLAAFLMELQDEICDALEAGDGEAVFLCKELEGERGGLARPRVLEGGTVLEKAAVNFSHARGTRLPPAATKRRPEWAGHPFEAASVSLIVHPRNPYVPTCHANFRAFVVGEEGEPMGWWFGGGYDLTPYYPFEEDCVHWHRVAKEALDPFGAEHYPAMKKACDEYFHLPHRKEARGIGGIFFDDMDAPDYATCLAIWSSAAESFLPAYMPILERRKEMSFGSREREFQAYRRGRYVEFNLIYDRGTRYGIQAGSRAESVLASLPPVVNWRYDWHPEPGSPEARLTEEFLPPRDWIQG